MRTGVAAHTEAVIDTTVDAAANAAEAGIKNDRTTIVAAKRYNLSSVMKLAANLSFTTIIPERNSPKQRRGIDKASCTKRVVYNNRRLTQSDNGTLLSRTYGKLVE